jgi:hypothetical protein
MPLFYARFTVFSLCVAVWCVPQKSAKQDHVWPCSFCGTAPPRLLPSRQSYRRHLQLYHHKDIERVRVGSVEVDRYVSLEGEALERRLHRVRMVRMSSAERQVYYRQLRQRREESGPVPEALWEHRVEDDFLASSGNLASSSQVAASGEASEVGAGALEGAAPSSPTRSVVGRIREAPSEPRQHALGYPPVDYRSSPEGSGSWSFSSGQDQSLSFDETDWPELDAEVPQAAAGSSSPAVSDEAEDWESPVSRFDSFSEFDDGDELVSSSLSCPSTPSAAVSTSSSSISLLPSPSPPAVVPPAPSPEPPRSPSVPEIDPAESLIPVVLATLRQYPMEPVDSIADRIAGRSAVLSRQDIHRLVLSAIGAEQRLAASLQSLVVASMASDPSGQTTFSLVMLALQLVRSRPA